MNCFSRRIRRWRFKWSIKKLRESNFCIIASNCVGSKIYQILGIRYNTPFVGLFVKPDCFVKLVSDFEHYMRQPLRFEKRSKYEDYNQKSGTPYPLGLLDDVEIHFMHYENEEIAALKWAERTSRIEADRLYFVMVADENTCPETIHKFIQNVDAPHVCFHNKNDLHLTGTVYLPPVNGKMGNLYSKYERFVGHFDFTAWIQQASSSRKK